MKRMSLIDWVAIILVLVGGLNWGLMGIFDINIVGKILGGDLARVVYVLIGVAAAWKIYRLAKK